MKKLLVFLAVLVGFCVFNTNLLAASFGGVFVTSDVYEYNQGDFPGLSGGSRILIGSKPYVSGKAVTVDSVPTGNGFTLPYSSPGWDMWLGIFLSPAIGSDWATTYTFHSGPDSIVLNLSGCTFRELNIPKNVVFNGNTISWDPVENATNYKLRWFPWNNGDEPNIGSGFLAETDYLGQPSYTMIHPVSGEYSLRVEAFEFCGGHPVNKSQLYVKQVIQFPLPVIDGILVPSNQSIWNYTSVEYPITQNDVNDCKPFATGDLSSGNLNLQVGLPAFSSGVDVYLAIGFADALFLVDSSNALQSASGLTVLPKWKSNNTAAVNESLYGNIPTSLLPAGVYNLYVLVVPAGETDFSHYYFWAINFFINHSETITFAKTFGGTDVDYSNSVQQTTDGGFIIAGKTKSFGVGEYNGYIIKTDSSGNETWSKTFGGTDHDFFVFSVQQTTDGGFIIIGSTQSSGAGSDDVYLLKTDSNGNETWSKTFGGIDRDYGRSVQQTADGGFIIAGSTRSSSVGSSDVYLLKTDSNGNETWSKAFGGTDGEEYGNSVRQTADGGFIIAGSRRFFSARNSDVYLLKTDSNGNETWSKTFGGAYNDYGNSVQQTDDGGFIIAGLTRSYGAGKSDVYLLKTDSNGNLNDEQTACIHAQGGIWENGQCALCDSSHLHLCGGSGVCAAAGGYWYDGSCNSTPDSSTAGSTEDIFHLFLPSSTSSR